MSSVYCCYNDGKYCCAHTTEAESTACINRCKRTKANKNLLETAGVPAQMRECSYSYMFDQYNRILGITDEMIQTEMGNITQPQCVEKPIV